MIITRTPLRISIGGGGTDLPSYYADHGGFVVAAAIDKHIYIGINDTFTDDYVIKYSAMERVDDASEIAHPIVREAMKLHPIGRAKEIVSLADIPAGTGLGSSGTFTVGLLKALYSYNREHVMTQYLAEEACHIEIELLHQPVGKQDQYIAAFGGLTCLEFHPDGTVVASKLDITPDVVHHLEEHLLLYFTGYSREATAMLHDQDARSTAGDHEMLDNLRAMERLGYEIRDALVRDNMADYAGLMHEHWLRKRSRSRGMSNDAIDHWYDLGIANGALGGKLVGAGAGGFLLFYAADTGALRSAMADEGLREVRFAFDHDGSTLMVRG